MGRYNKSEAHLLRAELVIPIGSQTFSKSRTQYPVGISPLYINKARGCHVWDIDGNKYIDLVSSLAAVTIGYSDSRINNAVRKQLRKGVTFSLPGTLEAEVAELICELVPSAEMVRFGKNGTDATSAAVRLARAYTGRDHIAVCGYHGWQDWYIGATTRNKGVPSVVSNLTHTFTYNDIESFKVIIEKFPDIACVVMEPMNSIFPEPGFLEEIRHITRMRGIVLVFDETITGFRFSNGGAQELFNITPDISTFGKGIANGFPLSAVVGKREIMMEMEEIFFSGTFGGELLSLAVARSVLLQIKSENVVSRLSEIGNEIISLVEPIITELELSDILNFSGHNSWKFLQWRGNNEYDADTIRTLFMQLSFQHGLLLLNTHNVSLAHGRYIKSIFDKYEAILHELSLAIRSKNVMEKLVVQPSRPLFRVR